MSAESNSLVINSRTRIPLSELVYRTSRASGPGGQHADKAETSVELRFDLARSPALTDDERRRAMARLGSHLDDDGVMHLESQGERSQLRNREEVTRRFAQLLRDALVPARPRRKTRPTRASIDARLHTKKRVGQIKRHRRPPAEGE
jgi:ribosome-associated protein